MKEHLPECEFHDTRWDGYVSIKISERYKNQLVGTITQAVMEKKINILVGTVALLGEGWDCPAVNSLIMASFVGSFMLSNQMRGRAIRCNKSDSNKVANIWHLVSITRHDYQRKMFSQLELSDYHTLKRRFQGFVGIAYTEDLIQNGLERLEMVNERELLKQHEQVNYRMYQLAKNRVDTKRRWEEILATFGGEDIKIVNTLGGRAAEEERLKTFGFLDLQSMILGLLAIVVLYIFVVPVLAAQFFPEDVVANMILETIPVVIGALWQLYFIGRLIGHFNPVKNMRRVGDVVLAALHDHGAIQTPQGLIANRIEKTEYFRDEQPRVKIYSTKLHGATVYENNLYIKCVQEIYKRVDNPRYVIVVETLFRTTYFNVPVLFANNKANAELFFSYWKKYIGRSKLVYTRNASGRKILLNARKGSFDYNDKFFERKRAVKKDDWK
jgi:hypothetical protein